MRRALGYSVFALLIGQGSACTTDDSGGPDDGHSSPVLGDAGPSWPATPNHGDAGSTVTTGAASEGGVSEAGGGASSAGLEAGSPREAGVVPQPDDGGRAEAGTPVPQGDGGGGSSTAKPSVGCGKSGRPTNGRVSVQGDHNYTFPPAYDGVRPLPLLIGFHAANNPIEHIENLTRGSDFERNYVRAFPKSKGNEWNYDADIAKVRAMYDDLMANYCVDTDRVFATGHSSGAQMIVQILLPAHKTDADRFNFKAVAPVAASRYGTVSRAIPVLYIQAQYDTVRRSDGSDVVKEFTTANGCTTTSTPYTGTPSCMSGGKTVMNGCIEYSGCTARTVWCSHDDPQYTDTFHGWPCFATKTIYDFFASLP